MYKSLFLIILLLSGCATTQGYKDSLQTWMGHSDSELMSTWGQPNSNYTLSNEKTVLEYDRSRTTVIPGYTYNQSVRTINNGSITGDVNATYMGNSTTYVPVTTPSSVVSKECSTRFTVNDHIIEAYSFNGNDCVAKEPKDTNTEDTNDENNQKPLTGEEWFRPNLK